MPPAVATWLLIALGIYVGCGALFALPFLLRWAAQLDEDARAGSWGFRVLVLPGVVALWPLLALRLRQGGPVERSPHRRAARALEEQA